MNQPSSDNLWTPTTAMIRHTWAFSSSNGAAEPYERGVMEFDRWLIALRAEIKHQMINDGYLKPNPR